MCFSKQHRKSKKRNPYLFIFPGQWLIISSPPWRLPSWWSHLTSLSLLWPWDSAILKAAERGDNSSKRWWLSLCVGAASSRSNQVVAEALGLCFILSEHSVSTLSPIKPVRCAMYMVANTFKRRRKLCCSSCRESFLYVLTDHLSHLLKCLPTAASTLPASSPA